MTVNVTADTLIEACDGGTTIDALTIGLFVEAEYDPLTFNAFRIDSECEGEEGEAEGPITAIDTGAGTVTIDCYGTPVTVIVDASTKITRNDATVTLADLVVGDEASAEYNTVTMIAKEIEVETPDAPESEPTPGD